MWLILPIFVLAGLLNVEATQPNNPICDGNRGNFVNDLSSCEAYFWCSSTGVANRLTCPNGLWFDPLRNMCVTAGSIPCQLCPPTGVTKVRSPISCRDFYQCVNGQSQAMSCGAGTLFHPTVNECALAGPVPCIEGTTAERCPNSGIVHVADMQNCQIFYICSAGSIIRDGLCG